MQKHTHQFERRRRHLPHLEAPGSTYFLTFTLRRPAPLDLTTPRVASFIIEHLRHFDGERYLLYDYTVMPDHVHVILKPLTDGARAISLSRIMHSMKSYLAHRINEEAGREGPLWQDETYDHIIRNQAEYEDCAQYIFENPHTKGLIAAPQDWPWWGKGSGR